MLFKHLLLVILSLFGLSAIVVCSPGRYHIKSVPQNCDIDIAGKCVGNKIRNEGNLNYQNLKVHPKVK